MLRTEPCAARAQEPPALQSSLLSYFRARHLFGLRFCPPGLFTLFPLGHFGAAAIPLPGDPKGEAVGVGKADSDPTAGWLGHLSLAPAPFTCRRELPIHYLQGLQGGKEGGAQRGGNAFSMSAEKDGEQQRILHVLVSEARGW